MLIPLVRCQSPGHHVRPRNCRSSNRGRRVPRVLNDERSEYLSQSCAVTYGKLPLHALASSFECRVERCSGRRQSPLSAPLKPESDAASRDAHISYLHKLIAARAKPSDAAARDGATTQAGARGAVVEAGNLQTTTCSASPTSPGSQGWAQRG